MLSLLIFLFLLFISESKQLLCAPYSSRTGILSVPNFCFVSDGLCPRMEALIPKHALSASYHGGGLLGPGSANKKDCQLPVPSSLARLPGLDSFAVAKICDECIFYSDISQKMYFSAPWPWILIARGKTRRHDQMCAGASVQINYVFFVIMS